MPMSRKESRGGKAFALPLFGIILLLAFYWVLADWKDVPALIGDAFAAIRWPS